MSRRPPALSLLLCLVLIGIAAPLAPAQSETPPPTADPTPKAPPAPTIEAVETALAALPPEESRNEIQRTVAQLYGQALEQLKRAAAAEKRAREYRALADEAPGTLQSIRTELEQPPPPVEIAQDPTATLPQLEQQLADANAKLQAARKQRDETEAEPAARAKRRADIPGELAALRSQLVEADKPPPAVADEVPAIISAREALAGARVLALKREIERTEAELASYDARKDLLPARRDLAQRRLTEAERTAQAWQAAVDARRQLEARSAERKAAEARQEAARQHEVLRRYAEETEALAATRTGEEGLTARIAAARADLSRRTKQYDTVYKTQEQTRRRLSKKNSLNRATGLLLRRQREDLPSTAALQDRLKRISDDLVDAQYGTITSEDERQAVGDIDAVVQDLMRQIEAAGTSENLATLREVARELATARRDLLDTLVADWNTYFDVLDALEAQTRQLLDVAKEYQSFIDERILWVRSITVDRWPTVRDVTQAIQWLFDPHAWAAGLTAVVARAAREWPGHLLAGLGLVLLLVARTLAWKRLTAIADLVGSYRTDRLSYTMWAVALTAMLALPLPYALEWASRALLAPAVPAPVRGVGHGLHQVAVLLLAFEFIVATLRARGLAGAHFRWPIDPVRSVRRNIRWFIVGIIPLGVLSVAAIREGDAETVASLGRMAFTAILLLLAIFMFRVFRPSRPLVSHIVSGRPGGFVDRLRYLWTGVLVLAPVTLIFVTWSGYLDTATHLAENIVYSLVLAAFVSFADGLLHRWLYVARRRVAVEEARRRREQAQAEADAAAKEGRDAPAPAPIDEKRLDLPAISAQTRQLFETALMLLVLVGLYMMWSDVLPALRMLDRVQVWPTVELRELQPDVLAPDGALALEDLPLLEPSGDDAPAAPPDAEGDRSARPALPMPMNRASTDALAPAATEATGETLAITLADIGLGLLILAATLVLFRNVPGLAEIVILQRLPLDAASRYAITTVLRYTIAIVGVVVAFNAIGVSWSRVQWLAAALTFGLAFGLQEIFANFVSGLIILGERPFRVGDTVTVGTTSGTVVRIRMRATTITDWDRKELIVPNKSFITGDVINWTLTDPILRIIIPVGVAYGSDVANVERTLMEVARQNAHVLDDPAPTVLFTAFGDSALNFELRVFLPGIDKLILTKHELHKAVDAAFRKEGIEISFPQRDLHLRTVDESIQDLMRRRRGGESAE